VSGVDYTVADLLSGRDRLLTLRAGKEEGELRVMSDFTKPEGVEGGELLSAADLASMMLCSTPPSSRLRSPGVGTPLHA